MHKVEVCLTPELIHQYSLRGKIVVVVDIFRATSCMVAGLATGVKDIEPVATLEECLAAGKRGRVMAGERGGQKVEGFDVGNSPFEYMDYSMSGKGVTVSTTNGTLAIAKSASAEEILIGAFLNLSAVAKYLSGSGKDVVIHCAGWKGTVNLEDTLYAGALCDALVSTHELVGDAALVSVSLFERHRDDLLAVALQSSHAKRLSKFGVAQDLEFCMRVDEFDVLPMLKDGLVII